MPSPPGPDLYALPNGSVIKFERDNPHTYGYVAIKVGGRGVWHVSGSAHGLSVATSDELAEFIGTDRCWLLDVGREITAPVPEYRQGG